MKYIHHLGWVGEFVSNSGVVTVFLRAFPVCVHVCVCERERERDRLRENANEFQIY